MAIAPSSVRSRSAPSLAGWPIVGWSALVVAVLCTLAYLLTGGGEFGWRAAIRLSAKTSLALFTAAFVASSVRVLWPNELTRWLLANRRYDGMSCSGRGLPAPAPPWTRHAVSLPRPAGHCRRVG